MILQQVLSKKSNTIGAVKMNVHIQSTLWMLGLLARLCLGSMIIQEPLEKKVCKADYVFRFWIVSGNKVKCFRPPTTGTSSPSAEAPSNSTVPLARFRRCVRLYEQDIVIPKDGIYKGSGELKQLDVVKVVTGKNYYTSFIRHSLNFQTELENGSYIFMGRNRANTTRYVLMSNPYSVEKWTKAVTKTLKNLDLKNDC